MGEELDYGDVRMVTHKIQTREHLLKNCPRWEPQQKIMWTEVRGEKGRGKNRFKIWNP